MRRPASDITADSTVRRLPGLCRKLGRLGLRAERRLLARLLFRLHFAGDESGVRAECLALVRSAG